MSGHTFQLGDRGIEAVAEDGDSGVVVHENDVDIRTVEPLIVRQAQSEQRAQLASSKVAAQASKPLSAADVIRDLKARLKVVNREIRARKELERERAQITRLLDAAKAKPAAVRAIRSAG